jgi:hypothetical protein
MTPDLVSLRQKKKMIGVHFSCRWSKLIVPPNALSFRPGFPYGLFSCQKSRFGLRMEDVGIFFWTFGKFYWLFSIFCGHSVYFIGYLVHFVAIWCIFPCFGMLYREKSGNLAATDRGKGWIFKSHPCVGLKAIDVIRLLLKNFPW